MATKSRAAGAKKIPASTEKNLNTANEASPPVAAAPKPAAKPKTATPAVSKAVAKPAAAKPAAVPLAEAAPAKAKKDGKKPKLVRDSFTLPEEDYVLFAAMKARCLAKGVEVKKSELLRAALRQLAGLDDSLLIGVMSQVERIKTGRPAS